MEKWGSLLIELLAQAGSQQRMLRANTERWRLSMSSLHCGLPVIYACGVVSVLPGNTIGTMIGHERIRLVCGVGGCRHDRCDAATPKCQHRVVTGIH